MSLLFLIPICLVFSVYSILITKACYMKSLRSSVESQQSISQTEIVRFAEFIYL